MWSLYQTLQALTQLLFFFCITHRQVYGKAIQRSASNIFAVVQQTLQQVCIRHRLVGLEVKASASGAEDPGFESGLRRDFSGVESYHWLKNWHSSGYPAIAWHYKVSAGTGRAGVSILWLGEVESWISNFYPSVAARAIVWADPSLRYTSICWDFKQQTNKLYQALKQDCFKHVNKFVWNTWGLYQTLG